MSGDRGSQWDGIVLPCRTQKRHPFSRLFVAQTVLNLEHRFRSEKQQQKPRDNISKQRNSGRMERAAGVRSSCEWRHIAFHASRASPGGIPEQVVMLFEFTRNNRTHHLCELRRKSDSTEGRKKLVNTSYFSVKMPCFITLPGPYSPFIG